MKVLGLNLKSSLGLVYGVLGCITGKPSGSLLRIYLLRGPYCVQTNGSRTLCSP